MAGGHGMMWETSLVMAIRPDWVDLSQARRVTEWSRPSQLSKQPPEKLDYIAKKAKAAYGNREIILTVERTAQRARDLLQ